MSENPNYMKREAMMAVSCPINVLIKLEDCKLCPYHKGYDKTRAQVNCEYETPSEIRMRAEPAKDQEYKTKW